MGKAAVSNYTAEDIEVLEGLEAVRRRPGMYIGGTQGEGGLHHLVAEILDNAIDEAMNGHADKIKVVLHKDGETVTVTDNGRGIPVNHHPKFKKSALEIILTTLHSGGKFSDHNYVSAGGLHGVGASVVNALSEKLEATIWRDGHEWSQKYTRGKPHSDIKKGKATKQRGTQITFTPDLEIFKSRKFNAAKLEKLIEEKAFLNKGTSLSFENEGTGEKKTFLYDEGVKAYLKKLLEKGSFEPTGGESFYLEEVKGIKVELAFAWTEDTSEKILSYVNGISTAEGGSHEDGFKQGIAKAIRNYISVHDLAKNVKLTGDDIREGLIAVISVNVPGRDIQLQFQGQTKDKLNNPEVEAPVEALARTFENLLNSKPTTATHIVQRIELAAKARAASRAAAQSVVRKVGISHRLTLPGKLADCSSNRPSESEIFIVEGDSAGGSAKQGRDRNIQAILPLKGKILNSFSASNQKVTDNKEIADLISALGCGFGDAIRPEKLRYGKVIILTDADADGMHIGSLLIAFFYKHMRKLIDIGALYLGLCPLYRIRFGSGAKEDVIWAYSDEEKNKILAKRGKSAKHHITRFKGLGEMNPSTLWETTLDPKKRSLLKISVGSAQGAQSLLDDLLGKDSSARYRLIQENAEELELDL